MEIIIKDSGLMIKLMVKDDFSKFKDRDFEDNLNKISQMEFEGKFGLMEQYIKVK